MSTDFEPAVRAPDVLVSARYEDGLPDPEVFLGTALLPFGDGEPYRLEGPWRFLLPSRNVIGLLLAVLMEIGSLSFLIESCEGWFVSVNDASTRRAVGHLRFNAKHGLGWISDKCYPC